MKYVAIAIVIVGGLMGLAVPDLLTAMQRSRQKRTMADIRTLAAELEERAEKTGRYALDAKDLHHLDGWGAPFELHASGNDYSIRSYGRDARRDDRDVAGATTDFARDIVYSNGTFVTYPEGI